MAISKLYNGATWDEVSIKTYNGLTWPNKPAYYNGTAWIPLYTTAVLTLTNITSSVLDFIVPYTRDAAVQVLTDGDLQGLNTAQSWISHDAGTEWIDDSGATSSAYEAKIAKTSGSETATLTGWAALDTFHDIDTTLKVLISNAAEGTFNWIGTLTIREKADLANAVTCTVTLEIDNNPI